MRCLKRARAAWRKAAPKTLRASTKLAESPAARKRYPRRCSQCGRFIGNANLGGDPGRGPLTGDLFYDACIAARGGAR